MSPPIISPYKKWFAAKRLVETFLGGPKLVPNGAIVTFEILIYFLPVGVILSVVCSVASDTVPWEWKALLTGVGMLLIDVALTFLIWILKQRKDSNVVPEPTGSNRVSIDRDRNSVSVTLFDEEENVPTDGCFKSSTWRFLAGNVNMSLGHFAALLASTVSTLLCVSILADELVHPALKAFVIFTVCNARYSSVINGPTEVATFDPVKRRHVFYRTFYVALLASVNFLILLWRDSRLDSSRTEPDLQVEYVDEENPAPSSPPPSPSTATSSSFFALLLSLLPLAWLTGILPPLDSLFPWLLEILLNGFGGKSIGYTYFGTTISLAFAVVGPLTTFLLSHNPKITFLLECLCGYIISCDTGSMPKLKASLCEEVPVKYFLSQCVKPAVTILCSLLTVFTVSTVVTQSGSIPSRDVYHVVFAALSIFLVVSTKLVQILDLVHRKGASSSSSSGGGRLCLSLFTMWHGLLTILLHVWLTLEMTTVHLEESRLKNIEAVIHSLQELLPCVLAIRGYALAVTEPNNSTITFVIATLYQLVWAKEVEGWQPKFILLLFFASIALSVLRRFGQCLRMMTIVIWETFTCTLLDRRYALVAMLFSAPLSLVALLISSVVKGVTLVPLFTLPVFTLAFPRPQSFWKGVWFVRSCGRNMTQKIMPATSSVDWTIYSDLAPFLIHAFAKRGEEMKIEYEPGSCFIARYDDRLLFIRVISSGWKFLYAQVKGLEIQEQTSCHHQEAAWIDEVFERYLLSSSSTCSRRLRTIPMTFTNCLEPSFCVNVPAYSESKSQLPNFLSKTGKQIFRDMFFRAFSYLWIKSNPAFQGESYRVAIATGVPLGKSTLTKMPTSSRLLERSHSFSRTNGYWSSHANPPNGMNDAAQFQLTPVGAADMNGNKARTALRDSTESVGSNSGGSYRGTSAPMRHHPQLKDVSAAHWQGSISYPLIPGLPNLAVEESELDHLSHPYTNENDEPEDITTNHVTTSQTSLMQRRDGVLWDGLPQLWMKQCVGDAIPHNAVKARVDRLCWKAWTIAFGTHDDLFEVDLARFYRREFAKNVRSAITHEKSDFEDIAVKAFRYATKLTLDEIYASGMDMEEPVIPPGSQTQEIASFPARTEEDEQNIFLQLSSFEKAYRFCPYDEVPYWINDKAKHIVSISADEEKNILRIFNYRSDGIQLAIGEMNRMCVEGIWATLNTELLYLTSDDDERYSIQHSKHLLRNICAQSAQTLGYPVYEATFRVNLFDFSLEQLTSSS